MSKNIITISREYGSGGRYIGEKVAQKLGYKFYDKEIIARIAEETGLDNDFIEQVGEYAPSKNIFAYALTGRGPNGYSVSDYVNAVQQQLIRQFADEGKCVIVGRCADYILRNRSDVLNVFIHADMPHRIERITRICSLSEAEAEKLIIETDKKRSINYRYYTDREWGKMRNYALTLNSSVIGIDNCADVICSL